MSIWRDFFGRIKGAELDRETLNLMADFENSLANVRQRMGHMAEGFGGAVYVNGPKAAEVLEIIQFLHRKSVTFHRALERALQTGKSFLINTGYGGKRASWSTVGYTEERIYLNLDQVEGSRYGLLALVAHEFGHAAAGLDDGTPGHAGPNQIWLGGVLAEIGLNDIHIPGYGHDLG